MSIVYLAGPLGFTESGSNYHQEVLRPTVERAGHQALDPWEYGSVRLAMIDTPGGPTHDDWAAFNRDVGQANEDMIRRSDCVLAVVDGSDVDSGTAAEIGFAAATGVPIVAIRSDIRGSGDNPATSINLQVAHFINTSGGAVVKSLSEAIALVVDVCREVDTTA